MLKALKFAKIAGSLGEVPVGAVIVKGGDILSTGYNVKESNQNALSHAELECMMVAFSRLKTWRLVNCDIYVTLEPCVMCMGAIINSRIRRVIFGAADEKNGACISNKLNLKYSYKPQIIGGILDKKCAELLENFFLKLRFLRNKK